MAEILALIEICFQDYLSDPARFRDILKQIYLEMDKNIKNMQNAYDARKLKRIFFTSRFGGWEHQIEDFVFQNGGRVIYADWFLYGFMNKIKTTGDMFENYAEYLLKLVIDFGCNNKVNVDNIIKFVLENKIDGVIYNQLFGCHSISTAYTRLKKKLIAEGIPSTMISFNNVGENVEQTKTRTVALMELLK
jgi:benzoyl-CoA reductase/2-hydroxyglutaryl-CoA dehydratase subunit BcrC/BadD/HgdB